MGSHISVILPSPKDSFLPVPEAYLQGWPGEQVLSPNLRGGEVCV